MRVDTTKRNHKNFLWLLAHGRLAEAEKLMINSPSMRGILLHLPALRHTRFFKERIRFYKQYARKNSLVGRLREKDRQTLRDEFAQSHCKITALKKAAKKALEKMDAEHLQRQMKLMRLKRQRRKRHEFGLF